MKGETIINMTEMDGVVPNENYRNVVALIAPFKDNSFVFKSYKNIDLALADQITSVEEAVGYKYLRLMKAKGFKTDIVLLNTTTGTGESVDYTLTNDKLSSIAEQLDDSLFNILIIPFELTDAQQTIIKTFWKGKFKKMEAFGMNTMVVSTEAKHEAIETNFQDGGIYELITTQEDESLTGYSLAESCVIEAAITAQLPENTSKTGMIREGVTGKITKEVYDDDIYQAIINKGGLAIKYRDRVNQIVEIVNSNTPTGRDLKIERVYHLIINEVRRVLDQYKGKDNNKTITYPHLLTEISAIEKTYKDIGFITGLKVNIVKTDQNTTELTIIVNEDDIIGKFDVNMSLIINED